MKKRLIIPILLVIVMIASVLAGCNLVTKDEERAADETIASVSYDGMTIDISYAEYWAYFQQNYAYANYYWGWSAEKAGEMLLSTLVQEKMLVLMARSEFSEKKGVDKNPTIREDKYEGYEDYANYLLSLLDNYGKANVLNNTNKMFKNSFDEELEKLNEQDKVEAENEEDEEEDNDEDIREPRPLKPDEDEKTYTEDDTVTDLDVAAIEIFIKQYDPDSAENADKMTENEKEAYRTVMKNVEKTFVNYWYYVIRNAEAALIQQFSNAHDDVDATMINAEDLYKVQINDAKISYLINGEDFKTAYEGSADPMIYHNGRYVKVKSILLEFSEEQTEYLKIWQDSNPYTDENDPNYQAYKKTILKVRNALVFGDVLYTDEEIEAILSGVAGSKELFGLMVYPTNPDYKEGDDEETAYEEPIPFLDAIKEINEKINGSEAMAEFKKAYEDKYGSYTEGSDTAKDMGYKMFIAQQKIDVFEDMIFRFNDDPGMFEGKDYVESGYEQESTFVVEYTALIRAILRDKNVSGATSVDTTSGESLAEGNIIKTTYTVGEEVVDIFTMVAEDQTEMSFIVNDYGVHIVILTDVPFSSWYTKDTDYTVTESEDYDAEDYIDNDKSQEGYYATAIYQYDLNALVKFDDATGKAMTVAEYVVDAKVDSEKQRAFANYRKMTIGWYGENVFDTSDDKDKVEGSIDSFSIVKHDKAFNRMKKEFKKIDEANANA